MSILNILRSLILRRSHFVFCVWTDGHDGQLLKPPHNTSAHLSNFGIVQEMMMDLRWVIVLMIMNTSSSDHSDFSLYSYQFVAIHSAVVVLVSDCIYRCPWPWIKTTLVAIEGPLPTPCSSLYSTSSLANWSKCKWVRTSLRMTIVHRERRYSGVENMKCPFAFVVRPCSPWTNNIVKMKNCCDQPDKPILFFSSFPLYLNRNPKKHFYYRKCNLFIHLIKQQPFK